MQTISSGQTFFVKRLFPVFWFGMIAVFLLTSIVEAMQDPGHFVPMSLFAPIVMLLFGWLLFWIFVWDLADMVDDYGDYLRVRRGGVEERVPLTNVVNVSMIQFTNPARLSLRLRTPCKFGDEIVFIPKRVPGIRLNPFARNPVAEDLIQRVERARQQDVRR